MKAKVVKFSSDADDPFFQATKRIKKWLTSSVSNKFVEQYTNIYNIKIVLLNPPPKCLHV